MSAYETGFSRGCDWAEADIRNGAATDSQAEAIRAAAVSLLRNVPRSQAGRRYIAEELGQARGYRFVVGRFADGRHAREMFEVSR